MNEIAARIHTTLYVFGERIKNNEHGQTTAEYVGIVAFVAVLVLAVIALAGGFSGAVGDLMNNVFTTISGKVQG